MYNMKKYSGITLCCLLISLAIAVNGFCNNNEWDPATQTLTLRGINIAGNTDPDQLSVFAEMKLVADSADQLRFKVTRVDQDSEKDEGTFYPDTQKVNFTIEIDSVNYNVWMVMSRDSQGTVYFVVQSIEHALALSSSAFGDLQSIPSRYTCDGEGISPALQFAGAPEGAASLVLIVDDPDAPEMTWSHWLVYNLPPDTTGLAEGTNTFPAGALHGKNDFGNINYGGPCPPNGEHRYMFKLYALDIML